MSVPFNRESLFVTHDDGTDYRGKRFATPHQSIRRQAIVLLAVNSSLMLMCSDPGLHPSPGFSGG